MASEKDYFIIPNPIYDVVFRYLMEDTESAMLILSTFLNQKIKHIQPDPTEKTWREEDGTETEERDPLHLFRLDFLATVELPDGKEEVVMIEVQKATEPGDYFRFKRYICKNFQKKKETVFMNKKGEKIKLYDPVKLIPIFILNFTIETEANELFIKTKPVKNCVFKQRVLEQSSDFIDNLSYELWVVQLPYLKEVKEEDYLGDAYKTKLYTMLELFDQRFKLGDNEHRLRLLKKQFPDEWQRVIRRLQSAAVENPDLEEEMYLEDEYFKVLEAKDNQLAAKDITIKERELAIEQKDKAIEQKDKAIEQKDKTIEQKDKAIEQKEIVILNFARMLKENGLSLEEIQKQTGLSPDKLKSIL